MSLLLFVLLVIIIIMLIGIYFELCLLNGALKSSVRFNDVYN
jgi:hypothetical protein